MAKLIELKEAAEMLGISPEELAELVDQKEIFGYRDGSTWKFKEQEIERVAQQLGVNLSDAAANTADELSDDSVELDGFDLSLDDEPSEGDSILDCLQHVRQGMGQRAICCLQLRRRDTTNLHHRERPLVHQLASRFRLELCGTAPTFECRPWPLRWSRRVPPR